MKIKTILRQLIFLIGLYIGLQVDAQNLITNPGFEDSTRYWGSFYTRDGSGTLSIDRASVHSGQCALRIEYPGTQDWAFATGKKIPVSPGQIYTLSCWVKSDTIANNAQAQFSVILYNASQSAVDWGYAPCIFKPHSADFTFYSSRFMVPEGVKYLEPRFLGWSPCSFAADDVSFILDSMQSQQGSYSIENDSMKLLLSVPLLNMEISHKGSLKNYSIESSPFLLVDSVKKDSPASLRVFGRILGNESGSLCLSFRIQNRDLKMQLAGDSSLVLNSPVKFPGYVITRSGEFMIIPRGTGLILPVSKPYPYYSFAAYDWKSTMSFAGLTNLKDGLMVSSEDPWDAAFNIGKPVSQTRYSIQLVHQPAKGLLGYNRNFSIHLVDSGYVEMCQWYRQQAEGLGFVKTFSEKKAANPDIDKLMGAVDFWALGWNLSSTFLDTLKLYGMDKALWNLTGGWGSHNYSRIIDSINARGYLSGRYDIFTDVWPPTHPEWTGYRNEGYPEDVIVNSDGSLRTGWLAYQQGVPFQGYYTCSETHLAYARKYVPLDLSTNRYNARFVDVELAAALTECFSTQHPLTRKTDAAARNRLLRYVKDEAGLVLGVEEAHDFAFAYADYGEGTMTMEPAENAGYDWSSPVSAPGSSYISNNIMPTLRVPLHGLTYHDVHIPTWYTGDGASKVPAYWQEKNLWNILYATMPLYMPPSRQYWDRHFEEFMGGYYLISAVTRNVGYEKMTSHQFISTDWKVQKTSFSNGWEVVANFGTTGYDWNGMTLAPKGFYAAGGQGDEVYRILDQGDTIDWACTGNRIYYNPHKADKAWKGIRTNGPAFIEKNGSTLKVAFVGKQTYLDIQGGTALFDSLFPEKASDWFSGAGISLTDLGGGWKRLQRVKQKPFYNVTLSTANTGILDEPVPALFLYPNPVHDELRIESDCKFKGMHLLSLCGKQLSYSTCNGNSASMVVSTFGRGLYICRIDFANGSQAFRKVLVN